MGTHEGGTPMGMIEDVGDAQAEAERWNSKGNAYLAVRDYITATSCFDLALKTHPGSEQEDVYLSNRATAQFRIGGYEAAVDGFRQAARLRPEKHTHFTCLGKVYLRWGGHEEEALEALEESLRLEDTSVAANLAAKARLAIERAQQWQAYGPPQAAMPSPRPHPPHRSPDHLASKTPPVQDFSKPRQPLVKISSTRIRGLLRSDSGHGGVAMISSSESVADDGSGGSGSERGRGQGRGSRKGGHRGGTASTDSLLEIMQNRTHFDNDDDDDDDDEGEAGADSQDGGGSKEAAAKGVKGARPPVTAGGKVAPRAAGATATAARPEIFAGLATGTPSTRRRHRRHRSRGSNSSLTSVESVGIVAAAAPAGPPAAAAAAGNGVVARAVARVEDGPADDTVKAILARAQAKQLAEEAVAISARQKNKIVVPKASAAGGSGLRPPPPPYAARGTPQEGADGSSDSVTTSPQEQPPTATAAAASNPRDVGRKPDPAMSLDCVGAAAEAAEKSAPDPSSALSQPAAAAAAAATAEPAVIPPPVVPPPNEKRVARTAQSPPPSPVGSEFSGFSSFSALSDKLPAAGRRGAGPSRYGAIARDSSSAWAVPEEGTANNPSTVVVVVRAGDRGRPETKPARLPAAVARGGGGSSGGGRHAPAQPSSSSSSTINKNGGVSDDGSGREPDNDGEAGLLSNVEALEAVAKAVRGMSSVDLPAAAAEEKEEAAAATAVAAAAGKPSAAAMAAIAAGAAPVKWGPEGAAERRAAAEADGHGDGDEPPDLGPFARHGRRDSSSANGDGDSSDSDGDGKHAFFSARLEIGDRYKSHEGGGAGEHRLPRKRPPPRAASSATSASDAGTHSITPLPLPPSYEAAEEAARLGIAPHAVPGPGQDGVAAKLLPGFPDEEGSTASWQPGRDDAGDRKGRGGKEEARRHYRRASDGWVRYGEEEAGEGELSREGGGGGGGSGSGSVERGIIRTSSLMTRKQRRKHHHQQQQQPQPQSPKVEEIFLDNEEGEWGQAPTSRFWRLRWPGRSRLVQIGVCLDSPKMARASPGSGTEEEPTRFAWDNDAEGGNGSDADENVSGVGSDRRVDPRYFLSTGSEPPLFSRTERPRSQSYRPHHAPLGQAPSRARHRAGAGGERLAATADVGFLQRSHSSRAVLHAGGRGGKGGGGGKKRLRRWVHGRKSGGGARDAVPSEESVKRWMRAVLGPRALGLLDSGGDGEHSEEGLGGENSGNLGLAEGLKDGRVLVRLAHSVGGARTAGMAEDLEAATPMMQLVNVHAFMAAARAVGVPAESLFHAKDLVDAAPGGPCSPAVLSCIAALSDAVRRNAATDPPGDVYDGPLLGDEADEELRPAKITEEEEGSGGGGGGGGGGDGGDGSVLSGVASKGSSVGSGGGSGGGGSWRGGSDGNRGSGIGGAMRHEMGQESTTTSPDSSTLSVVLVGRGA